MGVGSTAHSVSRNDKAWGMTGSSVACVAFFFFYLARPSALNLTGVGMTVSCSLLLASLCHELVSGKERASERLSLKDTPRAGPIADLNTISSRPAIRHLLLTSKPFQPPPPPLSKNLPPAW